MEIIIKIKHNAFKTLVWGGGIKLPSNFDRTSLFQILPQIILPNSMGNFEKWSWQMDLARQYLQIE